MSREPLIILVSPQINGELEHTLRSRYVEGYRIFVTPPVADVDALMSGLHEQGDEVALFVYESGDAFTRFLAGCAVVYPDARKLMIGSAGNRLKTADPVVENWSPPETQLYPVLDELLAEWRASIDTSFARVSGIMTVRTVRIRLNDTLHRAAEVIALSGIGDLMVIDSDNNFVGVLSVGDVLRAAMPDIDEIMDEGGTLEQAFRLFLRKGSELRYKPLAPLVITTPLVVHPDDHVAKAAALMIEKNIHRLPVVKDGQLVGTVGRTDICQAVVGTL